MFSIVVETQFKAAHSVALPDGSREPQHEHFWAVSVEVSSEKLTGEGTVMGFAPLKSALSAITSTLKETVLNEVEYFKTNPPTAENVAMFIFQRFEPKLPAGVRLESVSVSEQVGCTARCRKDRQ